MLHLEFDVTPVMVIESELAAVSVKFPVRFNPSVPLAGGTVSAPFPLPGDNVIVPLPARLKDDELAALSVICDPAA